MKRRKKDRYVQIYSTKPIPLDLKLQADPYGNETEALRLAALGISFLRDSFHGFGALYEDNEDVRQMWYSQGKLASDGTFEWQLVNWKRQVNWMTAKAVNWVELEHRNHDDRGNPITLKRV